MEFAVIGGDARFVDLTQLLREDGRDARAVNGMASDVPWADESELPQAKNVILNWPIPNGESILQSLSPGTHVFFCGPGAPENVPETLKWVDLWKNERLLSENARLTAEGAIFSAMSAARASISGTRCLVVGWGRIGRALTEMLVGLNAKVTVASRSQRGRNCALARGAEAVATEALVEAIPGEKIIFSTPPARVIGEAELRRLDEDAIVIDVASAPYGVDFEAAKRLGKRAQLEPKLPGRYCPYSAALALKKAILRAEGEEFHD